MQDLTLFPRKRAERQKKSLEERPSQSWAEELLAALDEIDQPARMKTLIVHVGWTRTTTVHRMTLLEQAARVERIDLGKGKKTTRWVRRD